MDAERKDTVAYMGHSFVNENPNGRRNAHQLAVALLNGRMSYPSYVILDEQNNKLTQIPGYMKAPELMMILKYFGENHHIEMSWENYHKSQTE
jgi:thioredoxin-related protein